MQSVLQQTFNKILAKNSMESKWRPQPQQETSRCWQTLWNSCPSAWGRCETQTCGVSKDRAPPNPIYLVVSERYNIYIYILYYDFIYSSIHIICLCIYVFVYIMVHLSISFYFCCQSFSIFDRDFSGSSPPANRCDTLKRPKKGG